MVIKQIILEIILSFNNSIKENDERYPEEDVTIDQINVCPIDDHQTYGIQV